MKSAGSAEPLKLDEDRLSSRIQLMAAGVA
jgi:hypothetical protein